MDVCRACECEFTSCGQWVALLGYEFRREGYEGEKGLFFSLHGTYYSGGQPDCMMLSVLGMDV